MEDIKPKPKNPTKKELQEKIKVTSKDNFKDTLDAFLKLDKKEETEKKKYE